MIGFEVEIKKVNLFVNSSPEAIVHLVLLTCKIKQKITPNPSTEICGNALKLELSEYANQMGALVFSWDLLLSG